MYLPERYAGKPDDVPAFVAQYPFATLVGHGEGQVVIDHMPMAWHDGALWGHLAFPNPTWRALQDACVTAVFHGPHAFIDHRWYQYPENSVPTWNYAVAHVEGVLEVTHQRDDLFRLLDQLQKYGGGEFEWAKSAPADLHGVLEMRIVGLKLVPSRMQLKQKMSQNQNAADRERVMTRLEASPAEQDRATAAYMRRL